MSTWNPMDTEPRDGAFRLYGIHVKHINGSEWFEVHYVAKDDDGQMIEPSGDAFSDWSFEDFEVWADAPSPPACNYPDCDGGAATGYCHTDCRKSDKAQKPDMGTT